MENVNKIKFVLISAIVLFACLGVPAAKAEAATLTLSPFSGSYQVGQTFSVRISVTSQDTAINAASGVISFPQDKLEITSLSKTGSIITLWVQDPSFSNNTGTINFEGVVLNPGFQGSDGKILTANFRVKAAGEASVAFASGSLLANDGLGTNIISGFVNADFGLKPQAQNQEAGESTTPSETNPLAPQISSLTHPDPNNWYNNNNPKFTWKVPAGVTAVKVQYDKYPQSVPSVTYTPAISEKSLENIPDGIWYFHVQFKDANGWGSVAHFRFQ
ncbi:MAG: cohesin domain-containing protein, partial [Minisyncoccia bacterium]